MKSVGKLVFFVVLAMVVRNAFAFEGPDMPDFFLEEPRKKLEGKGLSFDAVYSGEMVSDLKGGWHQRTAYLGRLDMGLTVDLEKAGMIPGAHYTFPGSIPMAAVKGLP